MGSAALLHLRSAAPLADAPSPSTLISGTAATHLFGTLTTRLLDPAPPALSSTQFVQPVLANFGTATFTNGATNYICAGRWLTRPLPAQTIGAGNWTVSAIVRGATATGSPPTFTFWGAALGQWRPGTGLVARFFDSPGGGVVSNIGGATVDYARSSTFFGGTLALLAGDCLALEMWITASSNSASTQSVSIPLETLGQYLDTTIFSTYLSYTDAVLLAPQAVAFS